MESLLCLLTFALVIANALSQPTATTTPFFRGRARLFIADNSAASPGVVVVDYPSFAITQRVALPGTSLQLGVSQDNAYLGVFRNRDNDQQFFSILSTGVRGILPAVGSAPPQLPPLQATEQGNMRPAFLAKSIIMVNGSDGIGGVEDGRELVYHPAWRLYLAYAESHGMVFAYRGDALHAVRAFAPVRVMRLPIGHYHVLPYGNFVIAPHTGVSKAYILNATGSIVREYACNACHGSAVYVDTTTNQHTAVFGCNTTVLVVRGTSAIPTVLPASSPRIGSFVVGVPGVFWSANSNQTFFWRTDVRSAIPTVSRVTQRGGVIRLLGLPSRSTFLAVHRDGNLVLYNGTTGNQLSALQLNASGFPANETSPYLAAEDVGRMVFVAVPSAGAVHVVTVDTGLRLALSRRLSVGGFPTAMAIALMPGVSAF